MSDRPIAHPQNDGKLRARAQRRARLAAELRSNLSKRKAQARGRALQDAPGPKPAREPATGERNDEPDVREVASADKRRPTVEVA